MGRAAGGVGIVGVSRPTAEAARAWVERTCAAQGVPVKVTDPAAIRAAVALVGQTRQSGSIRSGSKRVRPRSPGPTVARSSTAATIAR
jgi:hypothetical protein